MLNTLTRPRDEDEFTIVTGGRRDPGGFQQEARTGASEAAGGMKGPGGTPRRAAERGQCARPATRPSTTAPASLRCPAPRYRPPLLFGVGD